MENKNVYIFGAGLSGCTLARLFADIDFNVFLFEKKEHIGGNCFDFIDSNGVLIHKYGPHIFHTSYEDVWSFVNRFAKFNGYKNKVKVKIDNIDFLISFPINFTSINEIYDEKKSSLIIEKLKSAFPERKWITIHELIEEKDSILKEFANFIFENVYKNYTIKMWGIKPEDLDPNILKRVKINLNYDDNYFPDDKYQGLPIDGYTSMMKKMIDHKKIKIITGFDKTKLTIRNNEVFIDDEKIKGKVFYSGSIDELFNYKYGKLPYRSLDIKFEKHDIEYFQKCGVVNYPNHESMTRITEYKYLTMQKNLNQTTISKEFPGNWDESSINFKDRYYPINNPNNIEMYNKYLELCKKSKIIPIGRLAEYKYYDMDDCIKNTITLFEKEKNITYK